MFRVRATLNTCLEFEFIMKFLNIIIWVVLAVSLGSQTSSAQSTNSAESSDTTLITNITSTLDPHINDSVAISLPHLFGNHQAVVRQAGHWANYQQSVRARGSKHIASAKELEDAMIDFSRYDGARIAKGWMAKSALIALRTPEYVAGVRYWESTYGHNVVLDRLHDNPMAVFQFPGAQKAQTAVLRASFNDSNEIKLVGSLFKEQAYSMQKHSWANKKQGGKDFRLDALRLAPDNPTPLNQDILQALAEPGRTLLSGSTEHQDEHQINEESSLLSALKLGPSPAFATTTSSQQTLQLAPERGLTMAHVLGLAALLVLNDEHNDSHFQKWIDDPELRECVDWSRVHLRQCVAAGHFVFEGSFCVSEHQLGDVGRCVGDIISGNRDEN